VVAGSCLAGRHCGGGWWRSVIVENRVTRGGIESVVEAARAGLLLLFDRVESCVVWCDNECVVDDY